MSINILSSLVHLRSRRNLLGRAGDPSIAIVGFAYGPDPARRPPPTWASGVAYPRLNRIVLKLGPKEKLVELKAFA